MIRRSDLVLALLTVALAAPIMTTAFMIENGLERFPVAGWPAYDLDRYPRLLPFGYLMTTLPALLLAAINAILTRRVRRVPHRLLLALPLGAVVFVATLGWIAGVAWSDPGKVMLVLGLSGALVSAAAVALAELLVRTAPQKAG